MTGVPEGERSDAGDHEHSSRAEFRAQMHQRRVELERQLEASRAQFDQAQERINARTGRNLFLAVGIGVVFGGTLLLSLLVIKELFMVFAVVVAAFSSSELASALRNGGYRVPRVPTVAVAIVAVPVAYYGGGAGQLAAVLGGMLLVVLWRIAEQASPAVRTASNGLVRDLGAVLLVQAYVVFLATFTVVLTAAEGGQWWTLAFIIIAVAADTGAYASGLMFGRHPMAPVISPKKTWEGFAGGALASVVAGVILSIFMLGNTWWFGLIFGAAIFLTATLGDLAESLIKRDLGIKDMSSWLPGHGGFLDRLDSILPSAAVAFVAFRVFG
ncbi:MULTISPECIES: phosphatidate cytidylyltransferase [unclassified Agromyces]|uniref:phosphatidate cytidylyltransferase n=1 Tax=unclassified Agromyces TaxID=2639701 RepID=UPI0007B2E2BA|nr:MULTISPECIES: phosphatidate cytidylyltransferase [unclassified Agromyces]KZE90368.1 Phosphatidate cytidylyltransferase [Agromyces sp. NDB4Y10]MCK8610252.1 phosphatidate cytidylyltransferase [Agromyces sp. C10]